MPPLLAIKPTKLIYSFLVMKIILMQVESLCFTSPGCDVCSSTNSSQCQICLSGFTRQKDPWTRLDTCISCLSAHDKCATCNNTWHQCFTCIIFHYIWFDKCTNCSVPYCDVCNNSVSVCQSCGGQYGLTTSNTCIDCPGANCVLCNKNASICTRCVDLYGPQNGICVPCHVNLCIHCHQNSLTCTCCSTGNSLVNNTFCQSCATYHGSNECSSCRCENIAWCTNCTIRGEGVKHVAHGGGGPCIPCQNLNCLQCYLDYTICTLCKVGYAVDGITCSRCTHPQCLECNTSISICTKCDVGYSVDADTCAQCLIQYCYNCQGNISECYACIPGYGLSTGICVPCDDTQCLNCSLDYLNCVYCNTSFGVYNSSCIECVQHDVRCVACSANAYNCTQCVPRYAPNSTGDCQPCSDPLCVDCLGNINVCLQCQMGYGPNLGNCQLCADPNCVLCSFDNNICLNCTIQYGIDVGTATCLPCSQPNCYQCYPDYTICLNCDYGYGLSGPACLICTPPCLICSTTDVTSCASCQPGFYLTINSPGPNTCDPCIPNCYECMDSSTCQICDNGYFQTDIKECDICPTLCSLCVLNTIYNKPQCTQCIAGLYQFNHNAPPTCRQLCGDSVTTLLPCDNDLGIAYDGCSDDCEIQSNFTCDPTNLSICSYNGVLQITVVSIDRPKSQNRFKLVVKIFPPLYVFSLISQEQLESVFGIANQQIAVESIRYQPETQQLQIVADFNNDFMDTQIQIIFTPQNGKNPRFFDGQPQTVVVIVQTQPRKILHYKQFEFMIASIILYICYTLSVLGWVTTLLGFLLRRLAGIQAMFVVQLSWIPILWISPYIPMPYEDTYPLKYTCGYSLNIFETNQLFSVRAPYCSQFLINANFANNLSINLGLQLLAIIVVIATKIRVNRYEKEKKGFHNNGISETQENRASEQQQQEQLQETIAKYEKIVYHYQSAEQLFMYLCMLSLVGFTNHLCISIFTNQFKGVMSYIVAPIQLGILLIMIIRFVCNPDPYGFFRYSFKHQLCFAQWHYCMQFLFLVLFIVLQTIVDLPFISLVVCLAMLFYVIIRKPYNKNRDNNRAILNLIVLMCAISLKVFMFYWPEEQQRYLLVYIVLLAILMLLFAILIFSIIFIIYDYYLDINAENQALKNKSAAERQQQFYKNAILKQMTRAQVNRHVNNNRIPNLKQIVPGRDTLVNYSNQLKLKLNPSLNKAMTSRNDYYVHDTSSPLKLDPINLTHRRLNCEPDILKNNNTLSKGQPNNLNQIQVCAQLQHQRQKHIQRGQIQDKKSDKQVFGKDNRKIQQFEVKQKVVKVVLVDQNKFVNYQGAVQFVNQIRKRKQEDKDEYEEAYNQI